MGILNLFGGGPAGAPMNIMSKPQQGGGILGMLPRGMQTGITNMIPPGVRGGFNSFSTRMQNPLTQFGLGLMGSGLNGQDWGQGIGAGMQNMAGMGDHNTNSMFQQWLRQRMMASAPDSPTGVY